MMKKLQKITEIATWPKTAYFPNYQRYRSQILIAQIQDLNEDCIKMSHPYVLYFTRNNPSKIVAVGSVQFIVLNDSAIHKTAIEKVFQFFSKVLELFECRRGDPYTTANSNFVCFTHS